MRPRIVCRRGLGRKAMDFSEINDRADAEIVAYTEPRERVAVAEGTFQIFYRVRLASSAELAEIRLGSRYMGSRYTLESRRIDSGDEPQAWQWEKLTFGPTRLSAILDYGGGSFTNATSVLDLHRQAVAYEKHL